MRMSGWTQSRHPSMATGVTPGYQVEFDDDLRIGRAQNESRERIAGIEQTGARNQQKRFNQVWPWLQGQWANTMGNLDRVGGQSGQGPQINAGPVYGQRQQQQQINAGVAANNATAANQTQRMNDSLAGRGFGANSPLARALGTQFQMGAMASNADLARQIPWDAAQANNDAQYRGQVARETQYGNRMNEDIARRQTVVQAMNPLASLLGSFA